MRPAASVDAVVMAARTEHGHELELVTFGQVARMLGGDVVESDVAAIANTLNLRIYHWHARECEKPKSDGWPMIEWSDVATIRLWARAHGAAEAIRIASGDEFVPSRVRHAGMALSDALAGEG